MARKLSFMDCGGNLLAGLGLITASAIASNCYKKPSNYKPHNTKHYEMLRDYHSADPKGKDCTAEFLHDIRKDNKNKEIYKSYYDKLNDLFLKLEKPMVSIDYYGRKIEADMNPYFSNFKKALFNDSKISTKYVYDFEMRRIYADDNVSEKDNKVWVYANMIKVYNKHTLQYDMTIDNYYKDLFNSIINIYKEAFINGVQIEKALNSYSSNFDLWPYNAYAIRKYRKKGLL